MNNIHINGPLYRTKGLENQLSQIVNSDIY